MRPGEGGKGVGGVRDEDEDTEPHSIKRGDGDRARGREVTALHRSEMQRVCGLGKASPEPAQGVGYNHRSRSA